MEVLLGCVWAHRGAQDRWFSGLSPSLSPPWPQGTAFCWWPCLLGRASQGQEGSGDRVAVWKQSSLLTSSVPSERDLQPCLSWGLERVRGSAPGPCVRDLSWFPGWGPGTDCDATVKMAAWEPEQPVSGKTWAPPAVAGGAWPPPGAAGALRWGCLLPRPPGGLSTLPSRGLSVL